jgi:hypothetical protein
LSKVLYWPELYLIAGIYHFLGIETSLFKDILLVPGFIMPGGICKRILQSTYHCRAYTSCAACHEFYGHREMLHVGTSTERLWV